MLASSECVIAIMISPNLPKHYVLLIAVDLKNITSRFGEGLLYRSLMTAAEEVV